MEARRSKLPEAQKERCPDGAASVGGSGGESIATRVGELGSADLGLGDLSYFPHHSRNLMLSGHGCGQPGLGLPHTVIPR